MSTFEELLDEYWSLAYAEGKGERVTDTPNSDAQIVYDKLATHVVHLMNSNRIRKDANELLMRRVREMQEHNSNMARGWTQLVEKCNAYEGIILNGLPFEDFDGRKVLTSLQLVRLPVLQKIIEANPQLFEYNATYSLYVYLGDECSTSSSEPQGMNPSIPQLALQ